MTPLNESQATDTYDLDLHPHNHEGEHTGNQPIRTAYDIKELNRRLHDFPDNELRQIPVLSQGTRLEEGAIYLDLNRPEQGEFRGMNNRVAEPNEYLVPKSQTDYELWNKLSDHSSPSYRLGQLATAEDRETSDPNA